MDGTPSCPPASPYADGTTWDLVMGQCPASELQEVKEVLGDDVIDHLTELQAERQALREIADELADQLDSTTASIKALPEPPEIRERLLKEIRFFVESLRARKSSHPIPDPLSPGVGMAECEVLEEGTVAQYVMCETDSSRQGSSELSSRLRSVSRTSSSIRSLLTPEGVPGAVSRLSSCVTDSNSSHFLDSACMIREALLDDINEVQQDMYSLQNVLEVSMEPQTEIPTISALRKLSSKLEREYLDPKPLDLARRSKSIATSSTKRVLPPITQHASPGHKSNSDI